ncbi:MAG: 50S ribosomal protein L9 [Treponema sp.]|jgi:large subunit ribosomal protein L9|nr:50S ribosomal protein L9 [Treponema sp.]
MKVILNKDLAPLGEEGDVKDVARGYARNYLFPRGVALPYTESTIKLFESRKEEIEARKENKRKDALGLKEKLESLEINITMPAGANGKLYGAVTSQTVADELAKQGFQIERKRIELAGTSFKSIGKYKAVIKLYESASAEITITVAGQEIKTESRHGPARGKSRSEGREKTGSREAEGQNGEAAPADAQSPAVSDAVAAENPPEGETAPQAGDAAGAAEISAQTEPAGGAADGAAETPETPETAAVQE